MAIKFKNADRKNLEKYLKINDEKKRITKEEKAEKEKLLPLFAEYGVAENTSDSTVSYWGYVQEQGENVPVVLKVSVKSGGVDWQEYALALEAQIIAMGGTPASIDNFQKVGSVSHTIERMSKAMRKQLGI